MAKDIKAILNKEIASLIWHVRADAG